MPEDAEFVTALVHKGEITLSYLGNLNAKLQTRHFEVIGSGVLLEDGYLDTHENIAVLSHEGVIWHVFENTAA